MDEEDGGEAIGMSSSDGDKPQIMNVDCQSGSTVETTKSSNSGTLRANEPGTLRVNESAKENSSSSCDDLTADDSRSSSNSDRDTRSSSGMLGVVEVTDKLSSREGDASDNPWLGNERSSVAEAESINQLGVLKVCESAGRSRGRKPLQRSVSRAEKRGSLCADPQKVFPDGDARLGGPQHTIVASDSDSIGEWNSLMKPFVSDLTFRSFARRRAESEICFQPYTCEAALLFVDLSGYSKINAALASKGAHALSSAVNAYFQRLITIIQRYGGDVVKFAGDLVFVVWEGAVGDDEDLEFNLLCACQCALDLQAFAGSHSIKGTELQFRIHCGLTIGILESEVFAAPSHVHMQRLYHSVSGQCLLEISELVELAEAGEIAISQDVANFLGEMAVYDEDEDLVGACMLLDLEVSQSTMSAVRQHIEDIIVERQERRLPGMEEEFIHPKVLSLLRHGGGSPTQIAQMRTLVTLFIGMTCGGNSVNWLMEVQSILDKNRCPIVQLINDDKGVHIVAAVNLYESVPDSSLLALTACRELVGKQLGCAIGVAMGPTFCGVTGSTGACRWDIVGPSCVRAARLMQHALAENIPVVIDASLQSESIAATRMSLLKEPIRVKGTREEIFVYRLSGSNLYPIFRVLENQGTAISDKTVQKVRKSINTAMARCAAMVTGGPASGVTSACQRAATLSGLVPFSHICDETAGMAQLARSVAIWFSYAEYDFVRDQAQVVLDHMNNMRWSRAHDECVNLLDVAVQAGLRACFVLRRIQFLDNFSLSIIRECLKGRTFVVGNGKTIYRRKDNECGSMISGTEEYRNRHPGTKPCLGVRARRRRRDRDKRMSGGSGGKIVFLGAHTTLYQHRAAEQIVNEITRLSGAFQIKVVEVSQFSLEDRQAAIKEACDIEVSARWIRYNNTSTGLCTQSLVARAINAVDQLTRERSGGSLSPAGTEIVTTELQLCVADEHRDLCGFGQISGADAMKLTQSFDGLSPLMQLFLKVVAIASRSALFEVPKTVALGVTNDLAGKNKIDALRMNTIMKELEEMYLLKHHLDQGFEMIIFQVPALADIVLDVCTPVQIRTISSHLINRLKTMRYTNFKIPFMIAELHSDPENIFDDMSLLRELWRDGMQHFDRESGAWSPKERDWWLERLTESIRSCGGDESDSQTKNLNQLNASPPLLKVPRFIFQRSDRLAVPRQLSAVPHVILLLKSYVGPVAFGPLGHTLSVVSRNLFQSYGAHNRKDAAFLERLQLQSSTATCRFCEELTTLETFLAREGPSHAESKMGRRDLMRRDCEDLASISRQTKSAEEVVEQANEFLYKFVPRCIIPRIERVRAVAKFILDKKLDILDADTDPALSTAFKNLKSHDCWKDSTESALMTLATRNWCPTKVPEDLPHAYYQTVCRLRNNVLKQKGRGGDQKHLAFQHNSTFDDLAGFLLSCAVLEGAYVNPKEAAIADVKLPHDVYDSESYLVPLPPLGIEQ